MKSRLKLTACAAAGLVLPLAGIAAAAPAAAATTYTPLPSHVYAPYYETYLAPNTPSITATAQASGVKYYTSPSCRPARRDPAPWTGTAPRPCR